MESRRSRSEKVAHPPNAPCFFRRVVEVNGFLISLPRFAIVFCASLFTHRLSHVRISISMSLSTLPEELIKNVLSFVSDPASLLACERSCTTFRTLLAEDEMWRYCCANKEKDDRLNYRESAFVCRIIERIKESQERGDDNIILDVFGGVTPLADYVDELILDWDPPVEQDFFVRGDSLGMFVHILQDYFIDLISKAQGVACMIAGGQGDTAYPTVCVYHLEVVEYSRLPYVVSRLEGNDPFAVWGPSINIPYSTTDEQDLERRFKLIRRFADKAGAVKLTTEAMQRLGTQFAQLGSALLRDAIIELLDYEDRTFCQNPDDRDRIEIFFIAPPPRVFQEGNHRMQHVIVPRQICESRVYRQHINPGGSLPYADAEWIPRDGRSVEDERREAISAYFDDNVDSLRMDSFEESDADDALFPEEDSSSHWSAADDDEEDFGWVDEDEGEDP